ncbi:Protein kinase-like domain superfamily [Gonioctena quinquepunctata]|nr:Protein kinase-like domain superfamily [Gonioctena quinquepunctata]
MMEDYEILNILGTNPTSKTYKTKHKKSKELFVLKELDYEQLKKIKWETLQENIISRDIIKFCLKNKKLLSEEFLCRILYQISFTIKTTDGHVGKLQTKEVLFDDGFNVKLYNFELGAEMRMTAPRMFLLGRLLFEACTLSEKMNNFHKEIKNLSRFYSKEFLSIIVNLEANQGKLKENIDKMLCHPTVLTKSAEWNDTKCFMKFDESITNPAIYENDKNAVITEMLIGQSKKKDIHFPAQEIIPENLRKKEMGFIGRKVKFWNFKEKETFFQAREQELKEWEHRLAIRENRIASIEKSTKEKLQRADFYLKSCRKKSYSISSSEGSNKYLPIDKHSYKSRNDENHGPNLDSTYVSIGDSIILPTSKKLNVNEIIKPAPFTRTLSEKRIRFKGHSPLKDMDFNRRRSVKLPKKPKEKNNLKGELLTCSEDCDKSSFRIGKKSTDKKCKQLFPEPSTLVNDCGVKVDEEQCKPIKWTEENKKYAFQLLRMMNNDKENVCELRHTDL